MSLLSAAACLVQLFGGDPVTGQYVLFPPIAVWEMVIAGWLLVRGFSPRTGVAADPAAPVPARDGVRQPVPFER